MDGVIATQPPIPSEKVCPSNNALVDPDPYKIDPMSAEEIQGGTGP